MRGRHWLAIGLLLGFAAGCRDKAHEAAAAPVVEPAPRVATPAAPSHTDEQVVLEDISVETRPAHDGDLRARGISLGQALVASGEYAGAGVPISAGLIARRARLEVTIGYQKVAEPEPAVLVAIEAAVRWRDHQGDPAPSARVAGSKALTVAERAAPAAVIDALVDQLLAELAGELIDREQLRGGDDTQLLAALDKVDAGQVAWALELIAERQPAGAADAVLPMLSRLPPIRDAAIAAAVALRDGRAVAALTRDVDFDDRGQLRVAVEAVIALGGDDAREFLEMIATGHHDPDLARRAADGLERLDRREQAAVTAVGASRP